MYPIEYQQRAQATAVYHQSVHNVVSDNHLGDFERLLRLSYCATKLAGEKVGKLIRDYGGSVSGSFKVDLALELGDVLWYVTNLAKEIGYNLEDIMIMNIDKLESRKARGKLHGSGDHR
jgi:NTP pyrophosphatase (non-canonical NTP hydrolase)